MTIPDKAASIAEEIALDDSHGYDQVNRWGNPDLDCSALVIKCYKDAGLTDLTATYTGNMKWDFLQHGFSNVIYEVNIVTGAGMKRGDVLLNEIHHTAMYIGGGKIVHATGNEFGGIKGGQPGDQTGKEICIAPYFNYGNGGWDCVLRYEENEESVSEPSTDEYYTIQKGDTLWGIATSHGMTVDELSRLNNLDPNKFIYPGQTLRLKPSQNNQNESKADYYVVKSGDSLWQIAAAILGNGWSWYKIANANNLKFPYIIHPGDKLKIPEKE